MIASGNTVKYLVKQMNIHKWLTMSEWVDLALILLFFSVVFYLLSGLLLLGSYQFFGCERMVYMSPWQFWPVCLEVSLLLWLFTIPTIS